MTIKDKLDESRSGLDALLAFANDKTGANDTNIGDAVKTLADGFGGGGDLPQNITLVTVGDNTVSNTVETVNYFIGDSGEIRAILIDAPSAENQIICVVFKRGYGGGVIRYRNNMYGDVAIHINYDAALVNGSVYLVYRT